MTIIKIENDQHWHEMRAKTIGGSEIGIIFGSSTYSTPHELHMIKRGLFEPNHENNKLMAWGRAMEPVIAAFVTEHMSWGLEHCKDYHIHPDYSFMGVTLDYYVVESEHGPGLLEIKNVNSFAPNWTKARAPDHVELQIQYQFLVVNAARVAAGLAPFTWGAIGSMHSGNPEDIRIMYRKPDPKVHKHIIDECQQFWKDIEEEREPPLISHRDLDHITELFKQAGEKEPYVEIEDHTDKGDIEQIIAQYEDAKKREKLAKAEKDHLKAQILHSLMAVDSEGVTRVMKARTPNHMVETKLIRVERKPQPARVSTQLRFKIREVDPQKEMV